ncbi:hypothetical protein ACFU76_17370 [Streptomyces sp. NPDC057539]|uniref:hypothetical protein n=1 Tax=Streptomyces sp. NPDC057539 TaxID=3346159 RepID=UPI0036BE7FC9
MPPALAGLRPSCWLRLDAASATPPRTQRNDRHILDLLTKRAKALRLGPANYCWFTDPSRALCLKLAGTHRPVWAEHADKTQILTGQLGTTRKTERTRPQADLDRALRVVAEIDAASATMNDESS